MASACPRCGGFRTTQDQIDGWTSSVCINCGHSEDAPRPKSFAAPLGNRTYCVRCKTETPHRSSGPLSSRSFTFRNGQRVTHWRQPLRCERCGTGKSVFVPARRPAKALRA